MSYSRRLIELTPVRRERIRAILASRPADLPPMVKGNMIKRELGEHIEFSEAMSLLAQFSRKRTLECAGKSWEQVNEERFEQMRAQRGDLY